MAVDNVLKCKFEVEFLIKENTAILDVGELMKFLHIKPAKTSMEAYEDQRSLESLRVLKEFVLSEQRRYFTSGVVDVRMREHFRGVRLNECERVRAIISELQSSVAKAQVDFDLVDKNSFEYFWTASNCSRTKRRKCLVGEIKVDEMADIRFKVPPKVFRLKDFLWDNNYIVPIGSSVILAS